MSNADERDELVWAGAQVLTLLAALAVVVALGVEDDKVAAVAVVVPTFVVRWYFDEESRLYRWTRRRRAPQEAGYASPYDVVPAERYVTQQDAAQRLSCSMFTVGLLIAPIGRLRAVTYDEMPPGVDVVTLEEELARRSQRFWGVRVYVSAFLHGI